METAGAPSNLERSAKPAELSVEKVLDILFGSACEALVLAFSIQLFGGLAVQIVGGLWHKMTPSLPPIVAEEPAGKNHGSGILDLNFVHRHRLLLLWVILFVGLSLARLAQCSRNPEQNEAVAWGRRLAGRISREWFGMVVVNAFAAFAGVMLLQFLQRFSVTHYLWQALWDLLKPAIHTVLSLVPGEHSFEGLKSWAAWYNANQFKFLFWLLYTAAICDDLGLPNYKSLGKFFWQRGCKKAPAKEISDCPPLKR